MAKLRVKFTFPPEQIKEPVICEVGKRFDLVTNIRRADITAEVAWAVLELDGERGRHRRGDPLGGGHGRPRRPGRRQHHRGVGKQCQLRYASRRRCAA